MGTGERYGGHETDTMQHILWLVQQIERDVYGSANRRHGNETVMFACQNRAARMAYMRTLSYTVSFEGGHSVYCPLLTDTSIRADGTVTEESYDLRLDGGVGYYAPGSQIPETGNPARMDEMAERLTALRDNVQRHPNYCSVDGMPLVQPHAN